MTEEERLSESLRQVLAERGHLLARRDELIRENDRLRERLAAMTNERDRLREHIGRLEARE